MISTLLVLSTLAAGVAAPTGAPVAAQQFASEFPSAKLRLGSRGEVAFATSLEAPALDADPIESARRFLRAHGEALGISAQDTLVAVTQVAPGTFGTVVFERSFRGLQVLGAHVSVALTDKGSVHAVTSSGRIPVAYDEFRLNDAQARALALDALPGKVTSFIKGWSIHGDAQSPALQVLHPVYLVGVVAQVPYRSVRLPIDGVTGRVGLAPSRLQYATGKVYRISPSKPFATTTPALACPTETDDKGNIKHTTCAPVEEVPLLGLKNDGTLTGAEGVHQGRTTVYNCNGATTYDTTACTQTFKADTQGNFVPPATTDFTTSKTDQMSELMAYYQIDKQSRFMDSLDTNFIGLPLIPAFTNAYGPDPFLGPLKSGPFDNAFFDPGNHIMVFGQGSTIDFAYDAEVVYHEMTHAACGAIGEQQKNATALFPVAHARGMMIDPFSINEGNADAFSFMSPGVSDPYLGEFDARGEMSLLFGLIKIQLGAQGYIRNVGPEVFKTCQGNGTKANAGRDGEVHDDGEIWGEYAYEVYEGLKPLPNGVPANATYNSPATPAMFKALQQVIAAPAEQQTFAAFADLLESQVRAMYGQKAGDYVRCVGERRDFRACDNQVVTVYSGEGPFDDGASTKQQWKAFYFSKTEMYAKATDIPANFEGLPSGHQWKLTVPPGATSLTVNVCDVTPKLPIIGGGGSGVLYVQKGRPVSMNLTGSGATADWTYPTTASWTIPYVDCGGSTTAVFSSSGCTGCKAKANDTREILGEGDWYFLAANAGAGASFVNFKATVSAANVPARPSAGLIKTCVLDTSIGTDTGHDGGFGEGGGGGNNGTGGGGGSNTCVGTSCTTAETGCGCGATTPSAVIAPMFLLALVVLARRRRA